MGALSPGRRVGTDESRRGTALDRHTLFSALTIGWLVLATWSLPGLAFAVWAAANLAPRAHANDRWYRQRFSDYPGERKALIPRVW